MGQYLSSDTSKYTPALAYHQGNLYLAWTAQNDAQNLCIQFSPDNGSTWKGHRIYADTSYRAPALVSHNGKLFIAWVGTNWAHSLCVAEVPITPNGPSDLTGKVVLRETSENAPALASYQDTLYLGWTGMNYAHSLCVMLSPDGQNFLDKFVSAETSDSAPALVVHNNSLFIAWKGSNNTLLSVARVPWGLNADFGNKVVLTETSSTNPALASQWGMLSLMWKSSTDTRLSTLSSIDGHTFFGFTKHITSNTSDNAPALTSSNTDLLIAWTATNNAKNLCIDDYSDVFGTPLPTPGDIPTTLEFTANPVTIGGGVPVGGNSKLKFYQDGRFEFSYYFHKSSEFPFDYGIAMAVRDSAGNVYPFAHQWSFGYGVADDGPYTAYGVNANIAQNWLLLVAGASLSWRAEGNINVAAIEDLVKTVISDIITAFEFVLEIYVTFFV